MKDKSVFIYAFFHRIFIDMFFIYIFIIAYILDYR